MPEKIFLTLRALVWLFAVWKVHVGNTQLMIISLCKFVKIVNLHTQSDSHSTKHTRSHLLS